MIRTIPNLFAEAVAAVPDKPWLHHEDGAFTYAEADARIRTMAAALAERGVGRGDLVLATARNRPAYLFAWLATVHLGAIYVSANPRSSGAELAGLIGQVEPELVLSDAELEADIGPTVDVLDLLGSDASPLTGTGPAEPGDPAVLIPTSGTTGRSKLVTQTHQAYVMAGEGFPWWMELTAEDRLMTSLPLFHINAPAYSVLGSVAARAGLVLLPGLLREPVHRLGAHAMARRSSTRSARCSRSSCASPSGPTTPTTRCGSATRGRPRRRSASSRSSAASACGSCAATRCRRRPYGLIWPRGTRPYGTLGEPRQHPDARAASTTARVVDGELQLRNPAVMQGYWGMPEETERGPPRGRLAAHRRPRERRTPTGPTRSSAARRRSSAGAARTSPRPRSRRR